MSMDIKKAALNAVELLEKWSGDTVLPMSEFREVHSRAVQFNADVVRGNLVVMTKAEHDELLSNQKKRK